MIGEIVALVVLFAGVAIFGLVAWQLTLHVIGVDSQEFAMWKARFREWRRPETQPGVSAAVPPLSTNPSGAAERIERILVLLDEKPAISRGDRRPRD
jgi:hypothetical protein